MKRVKHLENLLKNTDYLVYYHSRGAYFIIHKSLYTGVVANLGVHKDELGQKIEGHKVMNFEEALEYAKELKTNKGSD